MPLNFELKARCAAIDEAEKIIRSQAAEYIGEDHQVDTYFNVPDGRMKLREGAIENALIFYQRNNTASAKVSEVLLYATDGDNTLKQILTAALGIKTVVDKKRKIYFIGNVKFHLDSVQDLGNFIEIEAIDRDGSIGLQKLQEQCGYYQELLSIHIEDLLADSYSDMLLAKKYSIKQASSPADTI